MARPLHGRRVAAAALATLAVVATVPPALAAVYDLCASVVVDPATAFKWKSHSPPAKDYANSYENQFGPADVSLETVSVSYRCLGVKFNEFGGPSFWASMSTFGKMNDMASKWANAPTDRGCGAVRVTDLKDGSYDYIINPQINFVNAYNGYVSAFCSHHYGFATNSVYPGANVLVEFISLGTKWDWEAPESANGVPILLPYYHSEKFEAFAPGPSENAKVVTSGPHAHPVCYQPTPILASCP